jgi:hypothetical protein
VHGDVGDVDPLVDGEFDGDVAADVLGELDTLVEGDDETLVDGVFVGVVRSMPVPIICFNAIGSFGLPAR